MGKTYCYRGSCSKVTCDYHIRKAPPGDDVSIADRNNGCYSSADEPAKFRYCLHNDCIKKTCRFHLCNAPDGEYVEASSQDLGCYVGPYHKRQELLKAICDGTQKTAYRCNDACKALCGSDGNCAYCSTIADSVEEMLNIERANSTTV